MEAIEAKQNTYPLYTCFVQLRQPCRCPTPYQSETRFSPPSSGECPLQTDAGNWLWHGGFTGVLKQQCHIDEWILNDLCEDCQEKIEQLFPGSPPAS